MNSTPISVIEEALRKAKAKLAEDQHLREKLEKRPRTVLVRVGTDEIKFKIPEMERTEEVPQITVEMDEKTFWDILQGEADPSVAYLTGKIKITASLADKIYFGKILKTLLNEKN